MEGYFVVPDRKISKIFGISWKVVQNFPTGISRRTENLFTICDFHRFQALVQSRWESRVI